MRSSRARVASPRAPSSITRSMRLSANVTPQARTTCRSNGARKPARAGASGRGWTRRAAHRARPPGPGRSGAARSARSSRSSRSETVGPNGSRSKAPSGRMATGVGPPMSPGSTIRGHLHATDEQAFERPARARPRGEIVGAGVVVPGRAAAAHRLRVRSDCLGSGYAISTGGGTAPWLAALMSLSG